MFGAKLQDAFSQLLAILTGPRDCLAKILQLVGRFDLICANLPYVAVEMSLPAEVVAQPARALYAEKGGAALVARLLDEAPARLTPGGRVLAELDPAIVGGLAEQASRLFAGSRVHRDAGGHERVLEAWC